MDEFSTVSILEIVQKEGNREVLRKIEHYSLDIILSIGYRANSAKAIRFRKWATSVLKGYIQNGYIVNHYKITEQRLYILENDVTAIKTHIKNNSLVVKQGIFYNGEIFDAYKFVSDLIKSAKKSVTLIDNYIDDNVLILLSKNESIKITIYTSRISQQLKLDIDKYNQQYNNLEVKISKDYHDRFLILDDKEVYHIGASLKDLGKKVFAFSRMDKDLVRKLL